MSNYQQPPPPDKDPQMWHLAQKRASFKSHFITYIVMIIFFWCIWYFTGGRTHGDGLPWPVWPMLGWGIGMFGQGAQANPNIPPEFLKIVQSMSGAMGIIFSAVQLALSAFYIFASTKMRKLESYGLVMIATILSMIPCVSPCCCVGLPIGIWILVVLAKPEVKAAFH